MESRDELKKRLTDEGRWEAFKARRDELKSQGLLPRQAWEQARNEFDSQTKQDDKIESAGSGNSSSDIKPVLQGGSLKPRRGSITKDFEWVYWHIGDECATAEDAPSSSAWWMLERVRSNPTVQIEFIRTLLQRLRPDKNESESERFNDDGRAQLGLIERVRAASKNAVLSPGA